MKRTESLQVVTERRFRGSLGGLSRGEAAIRRGGREC